MSDINANIVVSPIDLGVVVNTNQLTFTPEAISLNLYAGGVGTSNSLTANIANVHIFGGTNGYVLQTDGTGNLSWTSQTGGGGNGSPGGADTQVQYNNGGLFGGTTGFTFISASGNLNVPGNVIAPNFIGTASYATTAGFTVSANIANVANSVAGANVTGQVSNSLISSTVYTNAQPNITSVGTLSNLAVTGNISSGNANLGNLAIANFFSGNGSLLTGINGANVSNIANANYANYAGNVVNATQSNITLLGTLTDLVLNNADVHLGTGSTGGGGSYVAIGINANAGTGGNFAVAVGANSSTTSNRAVAIGPYSSASAANALAIGSNTKSQGANAVAMGLNARASGIETIAIGYNAGFSGSSPRTLYIGSFAGNAGNSVTGGIGIGFHAGDILQGQDAIGIGYYAGGDHQSNRAIAIGYQAGYSYQGNYSIAIGWLSGNTNQHNNSIILNATGTEFNTSIANAFFVKPIRDVTGNVDFTKTLKYNPTTGEIGFV